MMQLKIDLLVRRVSVENSNCTAYIGDTRCCDKPTGYLINGDAYCKQHAQIEVFGLVLEAQTIEVKSA